MDPYGTLHEHGSLPAFLIASLIARVLPCLGISFPAFVELCLVIARKHFWPATRRASRCSASPAPKDSAQQQPQQQHQQSEDQATPVPPKPVPRNPQLTPEMLRMAFTSFIDHCYNTLRAVAAGRAPAQASSAKTGHSRPQPRGSAPTPKPRQSRTMERERICV